MAAQSHLWLYRAETRTDANFLDVRSPTFSFLSRGWNVHGPRKISWKGKDILPFPPWGVSLRRQLSWRARTAAPEFRFEAKHQERKKNEKSKVKNYSSRPARLIQGIALKYWPSLSHFEESCGKHVRSKLVKNFLADRAMRSFNLIDTVWNWK